eukprot:m.105425 g.105425  ORF g.105425 m.105425 type:complete len:581 (-) comp15115_c0_seq1:170-1912(-)
MAYEFVSLDDEGFLGFGDLAEEESVQSVAAPEQLTTLETEKVKKALQFVRTANQHAYRWGPEVKINCARQLYELDYAAEKVKTQCVELHGHDEQRRTTEPAFAKDFKTAFEDLDRWFTHMQAVTNADWANNALSTTSKSAATTPSNKTGKSAPARASSFSTNKSGTVTSNTVTTPKSSSRPRKAPSRQLSMSDLKLREQAMGNEGLFEKLSRDKSLTSKPWYHGDISRTEAVERLSNTNLGTFLLRLSTRRQGITLSLQTKDGVKHFIIIPNSGTFSIFGKDGHFNRISDLVEFYRTNPLGADNSSLIFPCPKPSDKEDPNAHAYVEFLRSEVNKEVMESVIEQGRERLAQHAAEKRQKEEERKKSLQDWEDPKSPLSTAQSHSMSLTSSSQLSAEEDPDMEGMGFPSDVEDDVPTQPSGLQSTSKNGSSQDNEIEGNPFSDDEDLLAPDPPMQNTSSVQKRHNSTGAPNTSWRASIFGRRQSTGSMALAASLKSVSPLERIDPNATQEDIVKKVKDYTRRIATEERRLKAAGYLSSDSNHAPTSSRQKNEKKLQSLAELERLKATLQLYQDHLSQLRSL